MVFNTKKKTIYAQVYSNGKHMMMVDVCIQPGYFMPFSVRDKTCSYKWFTEEHFSRLCMKVEDVIMARVLSAPERVKKKSAKMSHNEPPEILSDPELLIQYHFKRRNDKQTILTSLRQESTDIQRVMSGNGGTTSETSEYSGGGYQSFFLYPEKLKVIVSQILHDDIPLTFSSEVTEDKLERTPASKSLISKYFVKGTAAVTRSVQKKQEALKNINRRVESLKESNVFPCLTSSANALAVQETIETTADRSTTFQLERERDTGCHSPAATSVSELAEKQKIENANGSQTYKEEGEREGDLQSCAVSSVNNQDEIENTDCSKTLKDEGEREENRLHCASTSISTFSVKGDIEKAENGRRSFEESEGCEDHSSYVQLHAKEYSTLSDVVNSSKQVEGRTETVIEDVIHMVCDHDTVGNSDSTNCSAVDNHKVVGTQCTVELDKSFKTCHRTKSKNGHFTEISDGAKRRCQTISFESESSDADCTAPTIHTRLAQNRFQKKHVTAGEEDNDFESPKAKRNLEKRKGSDLSDDQELTACKSRLKRTKTSVDFHPEEFKYSKRADNSASMAFSSHARKKGKKLTRGKTNKRQARPAIESSTGSLQEDRKEPGHSLLKPITIEDKPSRVVSVSHIEELTVEDIEQLVWGFCRDLQLIFQGKEYCRRHEDYNAGGHRRGDLAFQVHFGPFSEDQRDKIIGVLTSIFCKRHSKYFDYVSKVLLPETLVMLYMKVMGGSRDEAERLLLDGTKAMD